ncbi:hypothetical protein [Mucilaginibacter gotjawali]|uniref:Uncharacterized protein n=2 Tax=Mucilaginibacter gotjawali TaxID=1550579 RepID=A0A839SKM7_9SPHI|nr:hypothetical protein [Mucilaginibacter gotjawali]MBB3057804.1 hypothetical protein [Mucilaginibacter gotjawali]BAU52606.1 hypothetical protein MgSA37_00768 [Mucilaginibacter gotjawali]
MKKFKKILLCYAVVLAVAAFYADFLSHQKLPYLQVINFALSILNFTLIGILLYHWDKVRRWNLEIEHAVENAEPEPENALAAG